MLYPKVSAFIYLLCLLMCVDAQEKRKEFLDKLISVCINSANFKPKDLFGISDAVAGEIIKNVKYEDLDFQGIIVRNGPTEKVLLVNNIKSSVDNCLKNKNRKEKTQDLIKLLSPIFEEHVKPLYNKLIKSAAQKKQNGKSDADIRSGIYTQTKDMLTKKLMQTIISKVAKKYACPLWQCTLSETKPAINFSIHNCTKSGCSIPK